MKNVERVREAVLGTPTAGYFQQRAFSGWRPVAIIWERDIDGSAPGEHAEEVPFGLRISADGTSLVEDSEEKLVILEIFDGIVQDRSISQIANQLNLGKRRTRNAKPWTAKDVFELLPRLVEVGPRIFPTAEWAQRRQRLLRSA